MLSAIILLLIILPLTLSLTLSVPSVQNYAIDRAATWAGDKLGTNVSIGKITIGLFNRVTVRDFYVSDWDNDTLLYVKRADAYISSLASLAKKNLVINYGNVSGGKLVVRETERGTYAIKEITDQLVRRDRKSDFVLNINSLDASGVEFQLLRRVPKREQGIDFGDMQLFDIAAHLYDFSVDRGAVESMIENLSFVERSGFELTKMDGHFYVYEGQIIVDNSRFETAQSRINLDYLHLDGKDWLEYRDYINVVQMDCRVSDCTLTSDDLGYFGPAMWRWNTSIHNATMSMKGTVADFEGRVVSASLEDGGVIKATGRVKGLIDVEKTRFDINIDRVKASTHELVKVVGNIADLSLGENVMQYVDRVRGIDATGKFRGTIRNFEAKANTHLLCGGDVKLKCEMQNPANERKSVDATVQATNLDLSKILATSVVGKTSLSADVVMSLGEDAPLELVGTGQVDSLMLNGYNYSNLSVSAEIKDNNIAGVLSADDKALKFDAQALLALEDKSLPRYDAVMTIERADLHAMNINKRDSISVLNCNVGLTAEGKTLDEMNGVLQIADAEYETVGGRGCNADLIKLSILSDEDARTLALESDFADAVFESRTPYKDVLYYLKNLLVQYTPLLYDEKARQNIDMQVAKIGDEIAILSVTTKDIDSLLGCITDGLEMAEGSTVELLVSPSDNRFLMHASSEYLMHSNYLATNIDVKASNEGDSLSMSMAAKDLYAGAFHFSGVDVNGAAKDNKISLDAMFADSLCDLQGELSASAQISRKNNARSLLVNLNKSSVRSGDAEWDITTDGIEMDSAKIDIRRFAVRSDSQELYINGIASRSDKDSVYMNLRNFSLAPFTQITNQIGYVVDGRTSGYATVHSALKASRIDARIEMDSVSVSGIDVPDLLLVSQWDFGRSRATLDITTRKDNKRVIQGYFAPSQMRYYARMNTDGVKMSLLDPVLKGIISDTAGEASVDINISGVGRMAELKGEIEVDSLATTIDYTRCRYFAPKATVSVHNNRLIAKNVAISDRHGHKGEMSMDVSLAHLSNIEYNIDVQARNMEVLNTTERDNSMFYGSIFATGTGTVRGDKAGVKMDFVAHSDDNSKLYMPLTDNSDISTADFVKFATKERDTTSYLARKKMQFENRQKRRTSSGGAMDITLSLDIRPNAEMQLVIDPTVGDIIKGSGEGQLNMRINPTANIFEMYGDYTITKGSYLFTLQSVINKWFDIEPGSTIQWSGDPLDAILNIDAVYKLKASLQPLLEGSLTESNRSTRAVPVECFIHLTDRLMQPTVTFDIVVPSADSEVQSLIASALATPESKSQQFLYLIVANSFISESSNAMSSTMGASATAATGFEMLSNQFSNWLSSDDYKIVLRYRPRTEQMSDEVDFGFSKGLVDNRLLIELEGNYIVDKTQVVNANSNFTGEAYLTWLIDRAGTLRLKGFTHTIDRFDENQGLQETGIGIYFKEDFNNAKDLRMRLKNRFKRDKRREDENSTKLKDKQKDNKQLKKKRL